MNRSKISYTAQNGTKPPATLKMAHKTERVIFPLQGPAKEKKRFDPMLFLLLHINSPLSINLASKEKGMVNPR